MLLALETSGELGSVAVGDAGRCVASASLTRPRSHAAALVPLIDRTLGEAGIPFEDLTGVVVGSGPGSFTGVRVAAATAKALAHVLRIPLWPISSLLCAAGTWTEAGPARPRYVLFDARGDRLYAACYRFGTGRIDTIMGPTALTVQDLLSGGRPDDASFGGTGARRHRERLEEAGLTVLDPPGGEPQASTLIALLSLDPTIRPAENPARWEPNYVKGSSAERSRAG